MPASRLMPTDHEIDAFLADPIGKEQAEELAEALGCTIREAARNMLEDVDEDDDAA